MKSRLFRNTAMVMLLNVSKIALPMLTLPYLTRVLTTDCYGTVSYVKAVMAYMQTLVDFGFLLSATKHIAESNGDKNKIGQIVGINILSKCVISVIGFLILIVLCFALPILKENAWYTILSYIPIVLSIFLLDFLFRGIEKMEVITYRFLIMKSISTLLTFFVVKGDCDIVWIPILDIISSFVAIGLVFIQVKKLGIRIIFSDLTECIACIKESATYFLSNVASTSFNAFNTVVMGVYLSTTEIAYWSVTLQIINAGMAVLNPISDAVYPEMIRTKSKRTIHRILKLFVPIILLCSICLCIFAPLGLYIIGGDKYLPATNLLRIMSVLLILSFLSIIFGWPVLGAINRIKETTMSTVVAVVFQISAILVLMCCGKLSLYAIAVLRCFTELLLFVVRYFFYRKYRNELLM